MPTLFEQRHSASHVLAQAVLALFPEAKLGIGPAIDDGFYYDFELSRPLTPLDLQKIEKRMKQIIQEKQVFKTYNLDRAETEKRLKAANQNFKIQLVEDLNLPDYSFWENGPFVDLCRGPHVEHTGQIGVVKLLKVAGAYWKGSEKNPMLQRIYGTAFSTQTELDAYILQLEEAQKRDHRILGKQLDLFSISEDIGPGLILWHPKGAKVRHIIEDYWKSMHFAADYDLLYTPQVGRGNLWETSGHLQFYKENMFSAMEIDEQNYYVRPMNCPFHILVYKNNQHSYRNLPIRYAELGTVYRFERSGVLHGLMRVRGFTQDDAHIICTPEQVDSEINNVLNLSLTVLKKFGFKEFKIFLSTRPEEKYVGDLDQWALAENALKNAIEAHNLPYEVDNGGGAFYGPKIDIKIRDAIGREWQCSTVQFDFNLPERFSMTYIDSDGTKKKPIMIHRALFGSIERFFGVLIEHFEGAFPLWLAPVQIKLLTVTHEVKPYADKVAAQLRSHGFRVVIDDSSEKIGYKIRLAASEKNPYMAIIGKTEAETNTLSLRQHKVGDIGSLSISDAVSRWTTELIEGSTPL
jgi:threonyl-tRNA synthetase